MCPFLYIKVLEMRKQQSRIKSDVTIWLKLPIQKTDGIANKNYKLKKLNKKIKNKRI